MKVVLCVCQKDAALALTNLELCRKLDGKADFHCVVAHEDDFDASAVLKSAGEYFKSVEEFSFRNFYKTVPYPAPNNAVWQEVARFMGGQSEAWLWWEPDATPTKAGWVQAISDGYSRCGKPFFGPIVPHLGGKHINGVCVYPANVARYCTVAFAIRQQTTWDIALGHYMRPEWMGDGGSLIGHIGKGGPVGWHVNNVQEARNAIGTTVLIHGTDGSLPRLLLHPEESVPTPNTAAFPGAFINMGRNGDLINCLPLIRRMVGPERRAVIYYPQQFHKLMDGTTYLICNPWGVPGGSVRRRQQMESVVQVATGDYRTVYDLHAYPDEPLSPHYNLDCWYRMGMQKYFGKNKPVFDHRHSIREMELVKSVNLDGRPLLALALHGGISSPYADADKLRAALTSVWRNDFQILDLSRITATNFFDMLALLERAAVLITIDSAFLHLVAATETPVIALLSDRGKWCETKTYCNAIWERPYPEVIRHIHEVNARISEHRTRSVIHGIFGKRHTTIKR